MIDYLRFPELSASWGGPFNAQTFRQQIFLELIRNIEFSAIVETGTFRGTTTEYLHESSGVPVYTVEEIPRYYGYAKARFLLNGKIIVRRGDSRKFLMKIAGKSRLAQRSVFFYLDAHGNEYLPLREEMEIIFDNWRDAVVMIDDFKVPGDDLYDYDDYGIGKVLSLEYLDSLSHLKLEAFFPAMSAELETGQKRGCVVLAIDVGIIQKLKQLHTLVLHESPGNN